MDRVTASHKVLDILLLFRDARHGLTVENISSSLDIPKSTVYRHVRVLCEKGFLEKKSGADYQLGLTFLELSRMALNSNRDIRFAALPGMTRISEKLGESVSLMRLSGKHAICIENIEGQRALRVTIERGRAQALHAGASSKLLLAYVPENEWMDLVDLPLTRYTDTTITDVNELEAELSLIRSRGYSISDGEIDVGARAIAVPLFNNRNQVIAALSVESPESRMPDTIVQQYLQLLQDEASDIQQVFS